LKLALAIAFTVQFTTACISTTTGQKPPEADAAEAAESNYSLGRQYFLRGNYNRARDALKRSLEYDPRKAKTHMTLGLTYEQLDIPRLAAEHYEYAVRYEPRNIDVRNTYAVFLCRQREFTAAEKQFERVVGITENDNPEIALTNAGACMGSKPDNDAAEAFFRRALAEKPSHPEALLQLTLLKRNTGDYLSARAFLERYMAVQPTSPQVLYLAVQIEREMGNENAERQYERQLLDEFPDSAEARSLQESAADAR
jgi:type IV pilus assembly protein PilF